MQNSKLKTQNKESGVLAKPKLSGWVWVLLICGVVGLSDASYLTWEHFRNVPPPCQITWVSRMLGTWVDCGRVLNSKWAMAGPVPTAMLGMGFYAGIILMAVVGLRRPAKLSEARPSLRSGLPETWVGKWYWLLGVMAVAGVVTSMVLVYLMIGVIKSVCLYCLLSAVNTVVIGVSVLRLGLTLRDCDAV